MTTQQQVNRSRITRAAIRAADYAVQALAEKWERDVSKWTEENAERIEGLASGTALLVGSIDQLLKTVKA